VHARNKSGAHVDHHIRRRADHGVELRFGHDWGARELRCHDLRQSLVPLPFTP
jgi:hypothetical protein